MLEETDLRTGLDEALELEAVYYSAPVPRDLATLTVLGTVFDKVYFPGVYLPTGGFDQKALDKEILRIEEVHRQHPTRTENLSGILRFVRHAKALDGFCVFTADGASPFQSDVPGKLVKDLYVAIHGPLKPGWEPDFQTNFHKGMPDGSKEHVTYPGDYHYLAGALLHSERTGVPLLNDMPGLPVPLLSEVGATNKAQFLSAMLAIECVKLALPTLPLLRPEDLMEFRADNTVLLRAFRRGMLKYAGDLNREAGKHSAQDLQAATKFFVDTEIVPALDELRNKMNAPARSWYKRAIDLGRVAPKLGPAFYTMNPGVIFASILSNYLPQFFTEVSAIGEKHETLKRSPLYYLLQLQKFQSDRKPD
jgi:hypothetical protein